MRSSALENKTVRPGLMTYSFYASSRRQPAPQRAARPAAPKLTRHHFWPVVVTAAVVIGLFLGFKSVGSHSPGNSPQIAASGHGSTPAASSITENHCAGNSAQQLIKVSISARHLWACQAGKSVYDTAVITGMEAHASTKTPPGTYKISSKQTNLTLTGSDETGSWNDPVSYWMPFLSNQYGTYGFHDATWRPGDPFGKIDPNSDQASHGCVELPLAASAWLYNWAQVGTTVTIET